jgi:adenylyltransferase/sulfurtransferase
MARTRFDYSRQLALKEIGPAGQARLNAAAVLVVGAGGLGSPVLQYLAGAGVGRLGIVDGDVLDASNLHRQPIYSLSDLGRLKAELAAEAVARINPEVLVEPHATRLTAANAGALLGRYDLVIECSDNFRTKFLVNDVAVLARKPVVFASVYQYEGQLQVYKPAATHACLRCLWPETTPEGLVANCAEAGVLGPVPGAVGALQAVLALKILTDLPGQLENALLLMDFGSFVMQSLRAPRRADCIAPGCAHVRPPVPEPADLEVSLRSVADALARGYELLDIRTGEELEQHPSGLRHLPMSDLLADSSALTPGARYLLVCASGRRSFATAQALRGRGVDAYSLTGGLSTLEA